MVAAQLKARTRLTSDSGYTYEVGGPLSEGGFGFTYRGWKLSRQGNRTEEVCIKVCRDRHDWHGEAFFGELLSDDPRVVPLRDSLVQTTRSGGKQKRRYILVFDFMYGGTVWDWTESGHAPWPEAKVRQEIKALLKILAKLHNAGITHRDMKPDNVYLEKRRLMLGDFGITKMNLDVKTSFAPAFAEDFAPREVLMNMRWGQADDVYQVGLLAATLLDRQVWWNEIPSVATIAALDASDAMKSWIWHATGARSKRYWDATDALDALDSTRSVDLSVGRRAPRTLNGHAVVFTGKLAGVTRPQAMELVRKAGAQPQYSVNDRTTVVVVGKIKAGTVGAKEGLKLFITRERLRRGQKISLISERQFKRLTDS